MMIKLGYILHSKIMEFTNKNVFMGKSYDNIEMNLCKCIEMISVQVR